MMLTLSWPNPNHVLLRKARVSTKIGAGVELPATVIDGRATIFPSAPTPFTLLLRIELVADIGANPVVLAIVQEFEVTATAARPLRYSVVDVDAAPTAPLVPVDGLHPLLTSLVGAGTWTVTVDTRVVDVTSTVPKIVPFGGVTTDLVSAANSSSLRVLARTDDLQPRLWLTCTPKRCRGAVATDVLTLFSPHQKSPVIDLEKAVTGGTVENTGLTFKRAVFFGQGLDVLVPTPVDTDLASRLLDHFTPAGPDIPNFILARGWEQALVDSSRHVVVALPIPTEGKYHDAAGPSLPGMLRDVHRALQALGDITPSAGIRLDPPLLGVGGHSHGATAAFAALAGAPRAYREVVLMDPMTIDKQHALLGRISAQICLVGLDGKLVAVPFRKLKATPGVASRVRLVPQGYPGDAPDLATIRTIVGRSPGLAAGLNPRRLGHALNPINAPPEDWIPRIHTLASGKKVSERFVMLHHYCAQGADNRGSGDVEAHFLTQALAGSTFR